MFRSTKELIQKKEKEIFMHQKSIERLQAEVDKLFKEEEERTLDNSDKT